MTCCLFEHPLWDQRPGHGTWSAPKSFSSRQDRAMLSATHSQHGSNSASQGRGPVAATFLQFGFGNAAKDIVLGPERPNCKKKCCSLFQLRAYFWPSRATRATTGSDPGDIIYGHGEHTWPLFINLMVHVKSYLKFHACKAPLGAAGTKSRFKIFTMDLHDETWQRRQRPLANPWAGPVT